MEKCQLIRRDHAAVIRTPSRLMLIRLINEDISKMFVIQIKTSLESCVSSS